jgi:hypothetical protein
MVTIDLAPTVHGDHLDVPLNTVEGEQSNPLRPTKDTFR